MTSETETQPETDREIQPSLDSLAAYVEGGR